MGAFNRLRVNLICQSCGQMAPTFIQFKFGNKWQFDYEIGDVLRWGGNDEGRPGLRHVSVLGISEDCPLCGCDDGFDYCVTIRQDVLSDVSALPDPELFEVHWIVHEE